MPRTCPITDCTKVPESGHLMCKRHWFMVPQDIRNEIWRTYAHGRGLFTEAYKVARANAIDAVNHYEAADAQASQ